MKAAMGMRLIDSPELQRPAAIGAAPLVGVKDRAGFQALSAASSRAQVPVPPAESSDDTPGHGRPEQAFPGGSERPMSFDVPPLATPLAMSSVDRPGRADRRADSPAEPSFSEAVRDATAPPIPDEVWEQVDAAARLADELHARRRGVRFDVHKLDGSVVANLVDDEGGLLRPLPLGDVIDVDRLAHELSNEQP
jgi:hypothetical protein